MDDLLSIDIRISKGSWLPVNISYGNFNTGFLASLIVNNPVSELCETISGLQNNKSGEITWWLEPAAYFFEFQKKDTTYILTISFTSYLNPYKRDMKREIVKTITGSRKQIIHPFLNALKQVFLMADEGAHCVSHIDKNKIRKVLADYYFT